MMKNTVKMVLVALLLLSLFLPQVAAAEEAAVSTEKAVEENTEELRQAVLSIVTPYYEASKEVAINSPDIGRPYTDHKLAHALMCTDKTLEAGRAI